MRTVTLDILKDEAYDLLKDLEMLKVIRIQNDTGEKQVAKNLSAKYNGAMSKQSAEEIDRQFNELRDEWN
ncbi:hypothetical protein [Mucilaginibacter dorajii]|uniref:Uncharacterized protein n=1 Tax=Mucilaginibacter dorajii TaxID=692994 RepID=A0ABP7R4A6_9SPHI|nr:hypothetical protein [Mucilaginibacter dorajii]MCS3737902.1 hypothetical protein [Mucilaginibacter dorajii]